MDTVGERIKKLRIDHNMSQVEFAAKFGLSKQTLYKYENNLITKIPSDKIESIAEYFCISPSVLMGWDKNADGKEKDLCELFSMCHGKDAYQMVKLFLKLDQADRLVIYGRILGMLDAEKYKRKESTISLNA